MFFPIDMLSRRRKIKVEGIDCFFVQDNLRLSCEKHFTYRHISGRMTLMSKRRFYIYL